jgi:transposase-like protein
VEAMSKSKRRYFSPELKVKIIREHLIDGLPVSEVCEKHEIKPNQYFTWQKKFFERGAAAFQSKNNTRQQNVQKRKIDRLKKKLSEKDEIIAEVAEAFVTLKKDFGKA